jgi:hypothetical protein
LVTLPLLRQNATAQATNICFLENLANRIYSTARPLTQVPVGNRRGRHQKAPNHKQERKNPPKTFIFNLLYVQTALANHYWPVAKKIAWRQCLKANAALAV